MVKEITFSDLYKLSPFVKLSQYGIIPWKFIVHILLFVFVIFQVCVSMRKKTTFLLGQEKLFYTYFLNGEKQSNIFEIEELRYFVTNSLNNFYNIEHITLEHLTHVGEPFFDYDDYAHRNTSISLDNFSKLRTDLLKRELNKLNYFTIDYKFKYRNRYIFNVQQYFNFRFRGQIKVTLRIFQDEIDISQSATDSIEPFSSLGSNNIFHYVVLILASLSGMITYHHLSNISEKFNKTTEHMHQLIHNLSNSKSSSSSNSSIYYNPLFDSETSSEEIEKYYQKHSKKEDEKIVLSHVAKYVRWSFICLIGNFLEIIGALMAIFKPINTTTEIVIGVGTFFACLNLIRYIELRKDFSELYDTLYFSYPNVSRYLTGVFPIVLGFIFLGVSLFWENERFGSVSDSIRTLFSLMNGDSIQDILQEFKGLQGIKSFMGVTYGVIFILLVIMIILNIFIQIVTDTYESVKNKGKKEEKDKTKKKKESGSKSPSQKKKKENLKRIPKNLSMPLLAKKHKIRSLVSNRILALKNKELSNPSSLFDEAIDKKHTFTRSRKEMIEMSLSMNQYSIIEKVEEKSYSSSEQEKKKELEEFDKNTYVNEWLEKIKVHFDTISHTLDNIKEKINKGNQEKIEKKLDQLTKESNELRTHLAKK